MQRERYLMILLVVVMGLLVITGISPYDRSTWLMEVAPILIAVPVMVWTYRRFPLTTLLYVVITVHAIVLMYGGAYTYARAPLGFWLQEIFSFGRNNYDRIGHWMQGFVPALVAREVLVRGEYVRKGLMTSFLCLCVAITISAWYELIEWAAALLLGQAAEDFLGTQGDTWDTQWDMLMCFIGASMALIALPRIHDRAIQKLQPPPSENTIKA